MKKTTFKKLWNLAKEKGVNIYFTSDCQPWDVTENEFNKNQVVYYEEEEEGDFMILSPYFEFEFIVRNGKDYMIRKKCEFEEV